jgi:probable rRNA maturation factor
LSIRIFYDITDFRLEGWQEFKKLINKVIRKEDRVAGDLSFIITNDETVRNINLQFLNHDHFTDVIAFSYNFENKVIGEIYISIDTVKLNSNNYNVSLKNELLRVMIHGVLHLVGYDDKSEEEKSRMRAMEDLWLEESEMRRDEL